VKATSTSESPAPPPPPTVVPPVDNTPRLATWPEWFYSIDIALIIVSLATAFLITAYPARNSDIWLSLASGRQIASGTLPLGQNPFTHSGVERPWLQHSWIYDLLSYVGYSLDSSGVLLVAVKSGLFLLAIGLLLLFRKPGQSFWPWAMFILVTSLAVGPYVGLRSISASPFFASVLLVLLYRGNWAAGWRMPLIVGGVVALWANVDNWAILAPFMILLLLLGQLIDKLLGLTSEDDPLVSEPARPMLLRAFLIAIVACLLNPSFIASLAKSPSEALPQMLPIEMKFFIPDYIATDPEYEFLLRTPLSFEHIQSRTRGQNWNGLSFLIVLAVGIICLAVNYRRIRATHVLLFIGFMGLALNHTRLMVFLPIVMVPLLSSFWNAISSKVTLGTWAEPNTRMLVSASVLKRLLSLAVSFVVLASIYPGWVQPGMIDPSIQNRLEFSLLPDPGMIRTAQRLESIRKETPLPTDLIGVNTSATLGDYLAWFAPTEKAFINSRFRFHAEELKVVFDLRRELVDRTRPFDVPPSITKVEEGLKAAKCDYFVMSSSYFPQSFDRASKEMVLTPQDWQLWYLDGRSLVIARTTEKVKKLPVKELFQKDIIDRAFRVSEDRLPRGPIDPPPIFDRPFWETFLERPALSPLASDDVVNWSEYLPLLNAEKEQAAQKLLSDSLQRNEWCSAISGRAASMMAFSPPPPPLTRDIEVALPLMMLRSARQAIAATPDRPNGYLALARIYKLPFAPTADLPLGGIEMNERTFQLICARQRLLDRILPPAVTRDSFLVNLGFQESYAQAQAFESTGQIDFAEIALRRASGYSDTMAPQQFIALLQLVNNRPIELPQDPKALENAYKDLRKRFDTQRDKLSQQVQQSANNVKRSTAPKARQFFMLIEAGLANEAILLHEQLDSKDFGAMDIQAALTKILLMLKAGMIERVGVELPSLESALKQRRDNSKESANLADVRACEEALQQMKLLNALLERGAGNPSTAIDFQDQLPLPFPPLPVEITRTAAEMNGVFRGLTALGGAITGLVELRAQQFVSQQEAAQLREKANSRFIIWAGPSPGRQPIPSNRTLPEASPRQSFSLHILAGGAAVISYLADVQNPNQRFSEFVGQLFAIRPNLSLEAHFQFDRALMALVDGNIPEAERRFKLAQKPQGFDLAKLDEARSDAISKYLELIEQVRKSNPGK
jgi:hypothetical protein